jgi:hypothetical protein
MLRCVRRRRSWDERRKGGRSGFWLGPTTFNLLLGCLLRLLPFRIQHDLDSFDSSRDAFPTAASDDVLGDLMSIAFPASRADELDPANA